MNSACPFGVVIEPTKGPSLVVYRVDCIALQSGVKQWQALRDVETLRRMLAPLVQSRTDERRLLHYYRQRPRR